MSKKETMDHAATSEASNDKKSSDWKPAAIRIDALMLAVAFALAGVLKLLGPLLGINYFEEKFVLDWEYPHTFLVLTGLAELGAAALLLRPKTRYVGAMSIVFIMTGALITHKKFGDPGSAYIFPVFFFLAAIFITWNSRSILPYEDSSEESEKGEESD